MPHKESLTRFAASPGSQMKLMRSERSTARGRDAMANVISSM